MNPKDKYTHQTLMEQRIRFRLLRTVNNSYGIEDNVLRFSTLPTQIRIELSDANTPSRNILGSVVMKLLDYSGRTWTHQL